MTMSAVPGLAPLSYAQERLIALMAGDRDTSAYVARRYFLIDGNLDLAALRGALHQLVKRHEPLRTVYASGPNGEPAQCIRSTGEFPLGVVESTTDSSSSAAMRVADEFLGGDFKIGTGPLARCVVIELGRTRSLLAFALHYLVADAWAMTVFFSELAVIYRAELHGTAVTLPALEAQQADWALWQRRRLSPERRLELSDWWRHELSGINRRWPRPQVWSEHARRFQHQFARPTIQALRRFMSDQRTTAFTTLAAAWGAVLGVQYGGDHVVIGVPVANREELELSNALGFYVQILPVKIDIEGDPAFQELVNGTKVAMIAAYDRKDLPIQHIAADLAIPIESLSTSFTHRSHDHVGHLDLAGCTVSEPFSELGRVKSPLSIKVIESDEDTFVVADLRSDAVPIPKMQRMLVIYEAVLDVLCRKPTIPIRPVVSDLLMSLL